MSEYSKGEAKALSHNLDLIRMFGTNKDRAQLKGSGHASNRPLSKTFYKRIKKAGEKIQ